MPTYWWDVLESSLHYREAALLIDGAVPPDDARVWTIRARALAALGRAEEAAACFARADALEAAPAHDRERTRPTVRLPKLEPRAARALYSVALALAPWNAVAYLGRGRASLELRDWRHAADDLDMALTLRPDLCDASTWFTTGTVHAGLGDHAKAVSYFNQAIELGRSDGRVWTERGRSLVHLRQWTRAAADFGRAIPYQPEDTNLWYAQAAAYLGAGDEDAYRRVRAGILQRFGKTAHAGVASHLLYACLPIASAAEDGPVLLQMAKVGAGAYPGNERLVGAALYRAGRYQEAVESLERAVRFFPPRAWDWLFLAMAHHRLGRAEYAAQCLRDAVQWIEQADREFAAGNREAWIKWHESIEVGYLRREAEALLKTR